MKLPIILGATIAIAALSLVPATAQQAATTPPAAHEHTPAEAAAAISKGRRTFSPELEKIKALAGRWQGTTFRASEGTSDAVVTYEVTAAGSAVIEKLFPGTRMEMTTVYHDDSGGHLVASHYCNAGNQPKLRLMESKGDRMYFVLSPDSDLNADLEGHAHELTLTLGADGSLTHDWLNHYLGKPGAQRNIKLAKGK